MSSLRVASSAKVRLAWMAILLTGAIATGVALIVGAANASTDSWTVFGLATGCALLATFLLAASRLILWVELGTSLKAGHVVGTSAFEWNAVKNVEFFPSPSNPDRTTRHWLVVFRMETGRRVRLCVDSAEKTQLQRHPAVQERILARKSSPKHPRLHELQTSCQQHWQQHSVAELVHLPSYNEVCRQLCSMDYKIVPWCLSLLNHDEVAPRVLGIELLSNLAEQEQLDQHEDRVVTRLLELLTKVPSGRWDLCILDECIRTLGFIRSSRAIVPLCQLLLSEADYIEQETQWEIADALTRISGAHLMGSLEPVETARHWAREQLNPPKVEEAVAPPMPSQVFPSSPSQAAAG